MLRSQYKCPKVINSANLRETRYIKSFNKAEQKSGTGIVFARHRLTFQCQASFHEQAFQGCECDT